MIYIIYVILPLILSIMLYTLLERVGQAAIQHRIGPNITPIYGILQPLLDGLKLLIKEILIPQKSIILVFGLSPILSFILSILLWIFLILIDSYLGLLIILAIGGIELYGILLGGWASKNKLTLIGVIRVTCQLISYELLLGIIYFLMALSIGSFRIYYFYINPLNPIIYYLPLYIISLIIILAEVNRAPFDQAESEQDLVAGFMTEHSGLIFALYFLAEYSNMIFLSYLFSILFFSSYIFLPINLFFFIWIRATLPRLRFDHLLKLCWYDLLPISIGYLIFVYSLLLSLYI